jgi:hypothetical protein
MGWKQRQYAGYSQARYTPTPVQENPLLAARLEKIKKEVTNPKTKEFLISLSDFFLKKGGLTERQLASFEKIESRFYPHAFVLCWQMIYQLEMRLLAQKDIKFYQWVQVNPLK